MASKKGRKNSEKIVLQATIGEVFPLLLGRPVIHLQ